MSKVCKLCKTLKVDQRFDEKGLCWVCYAHCIATDPIYPEETCFFARTDKRTGILAMYNLFTNELAISDYREHMEAGCVVSRLTPHTTAFK